MRIAVLAAAVLLLAGCQLPERSADRAVTVPHAQGETVVERTPARVVALGAQWTDATIAMGVTPVGLLADPAGTAPPWRPTTGSTTAVDPAKPLGYQVKELRPELILLEGPAAAPSTYLELTAIAPTIPALTAGPVGDWRDQVRALGAVLREPDAAAEVIAAVDRGIERASAPGRTVAVAWLAGPGQLIAVTDPAAPALALFTRLGMRLPDTLAGLPADQGRAVLPVDRLAELDADLLVLAHSPRAGLDATALPGYGELGAARNDTAVLLDPVELAGLEYPTALSVPFLLQRLEPALRRAAG
ncbi:ABC transporter substrate-binding protein [Nocardia sp. NPDC057353]|uniref:ABC transporter substrate-binding protein n=1 Tax=Nocardia sp. NPDC057353 TaxID=3346104 RepID=UPI0036294D8A